MSKLCFPSLRITEEKMSNKEILETFNTVFFFRVIKLLDSFFKYRLYTFLF